MSKIVRKLTIAVAAGALFAAFSVTLPVKAGVPETDDPIKLAVNEWTGQHISTYVAGELLKKMGYNVEYVTAGYFPQMTALEDNTITATLEIWSSNIGELFDNAIASGNVEELGDLGLVPVEAWFYPAYVAEICPGLPDWEALKEPDCIEALATAETYPKGRFVDYPADWGTTNLNRIEALGLELASIPAGSEGAMIAEIKSAIASQKPLLMMFWEPHWIHADYDMVIVKLPLYEEVCIEDPSWGLNPDLTYDCDWKRGYIKKMAWIGMKDKWPAAHKFLTNYTLTNADQNPMMKAIDVDGRDMLEVIHEWIDAEEGRWKPWVEDALM